MNKKLILIVLMALFVLSWTFEVGLPHDTNIDMPCYGLYGGYSAAKHISYSNSPYAESVYANVFECAK